VDITDLLHHELKGSFDFFFHTTNLDAGSPGYGLAVDTTKDPEISSIASVGFALTAWVIGHARGYLSWQQAVDITRGTLETLEQRVPHYLVFL
jgi:hypothetical protein